MSESPWQDKDTLYRLYIEEGLSAAAVGERLGCTDVTVLDWLNRHDIPTRDTDPPTMSGENHPRSVSKEELITDYKRVGEELEKTPSQKEYNQFGEYSWGAIRSHFEGMGDIQSAAGLDRLEKGRVTLECEVCGEEYQEKHAKKSTTRFCSRECAGRWKSEAYSGEGNPYDYKDIQITCEWCGVVDNNPAHKDSRFCSQDCMIEWRAREYSGENHPRWKGGKEYYRGPNWERQRQKARERDDFVCQYCGEGDTELDVHHIIPFNEFDTYKKANHLQNLITLCDSCHSNAEWGNIATQSKLGTFSEKED